MARPGGRVSGPQGAPPGGSHEHADVHQPGPGHARAPAARTAELLETGETVTFGTPGYQGDFYGFGEGELRERGGTFDYLLAAVAACLTGTFGQALKARGIASDADRLTSEAEAHVEVEDRIMVMKRVTVRYRLRLDDPAQAEAAERAHEHHVGACGVARSVMPSLAIRTELELVGAQAAAPR